MSPRAQVDSLASLIRTEAVDAKPWAESRHTSPLKAAEPLVFMTCQDLFEMMPGVL